MAGGGTGGHLYPGLAIARALVRLEPAVSPFFLGARRGIEREILPDTEFDHELFDLHPLYRQRPWRNWRTVASAGKAWSRIGALIRRESPAVLLGTGGYGAALALARANAAGVPTVLQEQNSFPGLTTRVFARRAQKLYLGFPEALGFLRPGRNTEVVDSGNPIEPPSRDGDLQKARAREGWGFAADSGPVLLVVGGSQGAAPINDAMAKIAGNLTNAGINIIWGTGRTHFSHYQNLESDRCRVRAYLSPITKSYAAADLAVCRSGAITTAELCAWGIPAILVPLPTAAADHQSANARALEQAGCAVTISQSELTPDGLGLMVQSTLGDGRVLQTMAEAAIRRGRPDAARKIAESILQIMRRN